VAPVLEVEADFSEVVVEVDFWVEDRPHLEAAEGFLEEEDSSEVEVPLLPSSFWPAPVAP
jgi:hypothetical protein